MKRRKPTCGACGGRMRKGHAAIVLEGKAGRVATRVCDKCARTGLLVVCGQPHLTMAPRVLKKRRNVERNIKARGLLRAELDRLEADKERTEPNVKPNA